MSYQVLARKWRPRSFAEMVGQEHVLRAIINALDHDRLHHAFLFTGTRGVGKTTIARILAKSLNCEQGVGSRPCGTCSACREIDSGRYIDLIEVDAASRTKVEDTRELLDNVQYAPTRGRYKVYLIDEVHMLSKHSFNALLKTLEEPPPHVKFLLATTDPQKLPVTILSRCLQFNLKRLPVDLIAGHLLHVLGQEQISAEPAAVQQLARAAEGSMRDALSLLDQAIAFGGGRLREAEVCDMLGTIDRSHVFALLDRVAAADGPGLLARVAQLDELAPDYVQVLDLLISLLHRIALAQLVRAAVDDGDGDRARVLDLADRISGEDVQVYYQIALLGRRDVTLVAEPRSCLEMTLIRMLAFRPAEGVTAGQGAATAATPPPAVRASASATAPAAPAAARSAQPAPAVTVSAPAAVARGDESWSQIVSALPLQGATRALAEHCALQTRDESSITLLLDPAHRHYCNPNTEKKLEAALQQYLSAALKLRIVTGSPQQETPAVQLQRQHGERQRAATQSIENDSTVQVLREKFNARVVPDSIQPID